MVKICTEIVNMSCYARRRCSPKKLRWRMFLTESEELLNGGTEAYDHCYVGHVVQ